MEWRHQVCPEESEKSFSGKGWVESDLLIERALDHLKEREECGARRKNLDVKVYNSAEKNNQRATPMLHLPPKSIGEFIRHGTN